MLNSIMSRPQLFQEEKYRYLREFISYVERNRGTYPCRVRDKYYDEYNASVSEGSGSMLTKGYVVTVARREYTSSTIVMEPILQVVQCDGNIIVGRVVAHLSHVHENCRI